MSIKSGGSAVIIGDDENKTQTNMVASVPYPVSIGDTIKNPGASGPDAYVIFTSNAMVTDDVFLGPQEEYPVTEAGAVALQP